MFVSALLYVIVVLFWIGDELVAFYYTLVDDYNWGANLKLAVSTRGYNCVN